MASASALGVLAAGVPVVLLVRSPMLNALDFRIALGIAAVVLVAAWFLLATKILRRALGSEEDREKVRPGRIRLAFVTMTAVSVLAGAAVLAGPDAVTTAIGPMGPRWKRAKSLDEVLPAGVQAALRSAMSRSS